MSAAESITEENEVKSVKNVEESEKKAVKPVKSSGGSRIFAKISEMESAITIVKSELLSLSPEDLLKLQSFKEDTSGKKEDNLSALQKRLIKIVKDGDETFIRAMNGVVNSLLVVQEKVQEKKD
jgi:hypothetical protein